MKVETLNNQIFSLPLSRQYKFSFKSTKMFYVKRKFPKYQLFSRWRKNWFLLWASSVASLRNKLQNFLPHSANLRQIFLSRYNKFISIDISGANTNIIRQTLKEISIILEQTHPLRLTNIEMVIKYKYCTNKSNKADNFGSDWRSSF